MTTQHNMPPMPKTWYDRFCSEDWPNTQKAMEGEIRDLRAHAAAMAEKVRELEVALAKQTELTNRCTEAAAMFAKDAIKPEPSPPSEQPDWVRNAVPPAAARQPVEAEPVDHVKTLQFLTDVVTAAGLLSHGKTDKALASRISEYAYKMRFAIFSAQQPATVDRDAVLEEAVATHEKFFVRGQTTDWGYVFDSFRALKGQPATPPAGEARDGRDAVIEAARKLVKAKGRYHTEQNYKALADALAALSQQEEIK